MCVFLCKEKELPGFSQGVNENHLPESLSFSIIWSPSKTVDDFSNSSWLLLSCLVQRENQNSKVCFRSIVSAGNPGNSILSPLLPSTLPGYHHFYSGRAEEGGGGGEGGEGKGGEWFCESTVLPNNSTSVQAKNSRILKLFPNWMWKIDLSFCNLTHMHNRCFAEFSSTMPWTLLGVTSCLCGFLMRCWPSSKELLFAWFLINTY